jgi:hypothetical protein
MSGGAARRPPTYRRPPETPEYPTYKVARDGRHRGRFRFEARIALAFPKSLWFIRNNDSIRGAAMKISARNRLKGKIVEVRKGATTAHVRLDVSGTIVTASITNEAVDDD